MRQRQICSVKPIRTDVTLPKQQTMPPAPTETNVIPVWRTGECVCEGQCPRCQVESSAALEQEADSATAFNRFPTHQGLHSLPQKQPDRTLFVGSGHVLPNAIRQQHETRLGYDLATVRVHTDASTHAISQQMDAQAFTHGAHIGFQDGQYAPHTATGQSLLGHELMHVAQQARGVATGVQLSKKKLPKASAATTPSVNTNRPKPDQRKWKQIAIMDNNKNRDRFNYFFSALIFGEIDGKSVDQMVDAIIKKTGDPTQNSIGQLSIIGHGTAGNISVGAGKSDDDERQISNNGFQPSLAKLIPYFRDDSIVLLYGCNVGLGVTGARFVQSLADYWKVNVFAPTGRVDPMGYQGVLEIGAPGKVLPSDYLIVTEQIVRIMDSDPYGDDEEMIMELLETCWGDGSVMKIRRELEQRGRWQELADKLIDEDEGRFYKIYPGHAKGYWDEVYRVRQSLPTIK